MAAIERLVATDKLRTTRLKAACEQRAHLYYYYDNDFDALHILLVSPDVETVVHYVDDHVALLYEPDTLEIVGLQVENFEFSFMPQHEEVRRVWQLSEALGRELENVGDMMLAIETKKPEVVREVVRASRKALGKQARVLEAAFMSSQPC